MQFLGVKCWHLVWKHVLLIMRSPIKICLLESSKIRWIIYSSPSSVLIPSHQITLLSHRSKIMTRENCTVTFTLTSSSCSPTCNWAELRHVGSIVNTTSIYTSWWDWPVGILVKFLGKLIAVHSVHITSIALLLSWRFLPLPLSMKGFLL